MERYRREYPERVRASERKWREAHLDECRVRQRAYYEAHGEELRAGAREYRHAHKEEVNARSLEYYYQHKEECQAQTRKYREEHVDELRAYGQQYRQTDNGRTIHLRSENKRRARKAELSATLTIAEWESTLSFFENRCAYCGVGDVPLHQEHIVALAAGGGYVAQNIVPACKRCNLSKTSTPLAEWLTGRGAAFVLPDAISNIEAYIGSVETAQ